VENWKGEAPLVKEPYGYGHDPKLIDLGSVTGQQLWS
jgi:cytochrome c oxidase subunit 1